VGGVGLEKEFGRKDQVTCDMLEQRGSGKDITACIKDWLGAAP
jgi:hypothetical protein